MAFLFRIGSKPVLAITIFLLIVFLAACSDRSENDLAVFRVLDESLVNANKTINKGTEMQLATLNGKTTEPASAYRANIWYPKAMAVKEKSTGIISYLDELKLLLKKEAGLESSGNSFNEADKAAVERLFESEGKGRYMYEKLNRYRADVLAIDSGIRVTFIDMILPSIPSPDSLTKETKTFFKNITAAAALAVLSKFQNDIKITENRLIAFCNNKVGSFIESYTTYSAIVGQSSSYVRVGEEIEITAGIGSFSRAVRPEITVNKMNIEINESGTAVYKFKASTKTGKHTVPVKINFTGEDGIRQEITKDVEYTVLK